MRSAGIKAPSLINVDPNTMLDFMRQERLVTRDRVALPLQRISDTRGGNPHLLCTILMSIL
jgi:hypothetical protein